MIRSSQTYSSALAYSKVAIGEWLAAASPNDTYETVLLRMTLGVRPMSWIDGSPYLDAPDNSLCHLAEMAISNLACRDLLREIVSTKLICGKPLRDAERTFAGQELGGHLPTLAKKAGKKAGKNFWRTAAAVLLARTLVEKFDLSLTRNDEVKVHQSACDVVVLAFRAAGIGATFHSVKDAVLSTKRTGEIDAVLAAIRAQAREPAAVRAGVVG